MTEPPQTAERRLTLEDALARLPRLDMAYKIPPSSSPDDDALTVLATILSGGRSSRFYEPSCARSSWRPSVVGVRRRDARARASSDRRTALPGKTLTELEAAIDAEIERVKTGPIADWEIEKARTSARRAVVGALGSSLQRAIMSQYALFYNDRTGSTRSADRIAKVTAADVQRVARQYLVKTGRTVVMTCRKPPRRREDSDGTATTSVVACSALALVRDAVGLARRVSRRRSGRRRPPQMVLKGKAPVSERDSEGQAAAAAGSGPAERPAPDGARGSAAAAGHLSAHHSGRGRLLRSGRPVGLASYTAA